MLIIGGGAAGLMCAYSACLHGAKVVLLEKNEKCGKKIYITGKGRCNLTNACDTVDFFSNIISNRRFLYSAISRFDAKSVCEFFEKQNCPLKTERGERVFPSSDKASDITAALVGAIIRLGGKIMYNARVLSVTHMQESFVVKTSIGDFSDCAVVITTGGKSYPSTGSTGDGLNFASAFGHTIVPCVPALSALLADNTRELAGLSLKNVESSIVKNGKILCSEFGEMLFTHEGVSGPSVLTLSSKINRENFDETWFYVDLKPALSQEKLNNRLLRDFSENTNKQIDNVLGLLMPKALIPYVLNQSNISSETAINSVTKEQRSKLISTVKGLRFKLLGLAPLEEAIVTAGGVSVKEVSPKTMESKLVKGLFFAGEVLDYDCLTGGFNIQSAFSTGYVAGLSAAELYS